MDDQADRNEHNILPNLIVSFQFMYVEYMSSWGCKFFLERVNQWNLMDTIPNKNTKEYIICDTYLYMYTMYMYHKND